MINIQLMGKGAQKGKMNTWQRGANFPTEKNFKGLGPLIFNIN